MDVYEAIKDLPTPYYDDGDGRVIFCGDCRELLPLLGEVDLVLTDPPYEIHAGAGGGAFGGRRHLIETGGFTDCGVNYDFLNGVSCWFCFCSLRQLPELLARANDMERMSLLQWNKPNPVPTCNNKYLPDVEYIVHGFRKGRLFGEYTDKSSFHVYRVGDRDTCHPNEKPIPVVARLVRLGSAEMEILCDPFMGSGTTLIAARDLGRQAIGIEIEERYCEIAANRLRQKVLF